MPILRRIHGPALAAPLFAALTRPVAGWLWQKWLRSDDFSRGPLALIAAALLAWRL